jgi:hypothetical protein
MWATEYVNTQAKRLLLYTSRHHASADNPGGC